MIHMLNGIICLWLHFACPAACQQSASCVTAKAKSRVWMSPWNVNNAIVWLLFLLSVLNTTRTDCVFHDKICAAVAGISLFIVFVLAFPMILLAVLGFTHTIKFLPRSRSFSRRVRIVRLKKSMPINDNQYNRHVCCPAKFPDNSWRH